MPTPEIHIANQRRPLRPVPRIRSHIPVLGHSALLAWNADRVLTWYRRRHGDVFALQFPEGPRIFLLDPRDHRIVSANPHIALEDFATDFCVKSFDHSHEGVERCGTALLSRMVSRHLKGDRLHATTERMQLTFERRLLTQIGRDWHTDRLHRWIARHVFASATDALFGEGIYTDELWRHYRILDRYVPLLYVGVPARLLPGCTEARHHVGDRLNIRRPDATPLVVERRRLFDQHHLDPVETGRIETAFLWAAQANTVATAFWVLLHVFRDREARRAILEEVRAIVAGSDVEYGAIPFSQEHLKDMVRLDSAISEALRLAAAPMLPRIADTEVELELHSGTIRVASRQVVCLYPRLMHRDPEIFADPLRFRYDRFLHGAKFDKRGTPIRSPLLSFGAGSSICPGRAFARNEFKVIVATLLAHFDFELRSTAVPPFDMTRVGFGTLSPRRDVAFRLRRAAPRVGGRRPAAPGDR